jgi:hypothetical protein
MNQLIADNRRPTPFDPLAIDNLLEPEVSFKHKHSELILTQIREHG